MTRVVVAVGRDLLNGGVMLLPDVHNLFNLYASELSSHLREEIDTSKLVTSANILSNIKVNLQHHIAYSCKMRKHGTLIYRPNADLRPALAQALWRLRSKNITKECSSETNTSKSDDPQQYLNVLDDLNTRACSHITSYLSKHNKQNFEFVDLDIDKEIEGTDPKLWEAICLLSSGQHLKEEAYLKLPTHHHEPTTPKKSDALTFTVHSCFALMMTI